MNYYMAIIINNISPRELDMASLSILMARNLL